jgi:hypothetical protein
VPFAVDAADMHGVAHIAVVARDRDVTPSLHRIAGLSKISISFVAIDNA